VRSAGPALSRFAVAVSGHEISEVTVISRIFTGFEGRIEFTCPSPGSTKNAKLSGQEFHSASCEI
jgi:hypothetical protein